MDYYDSNEDSEDILAKVNRFEEMLSSKTSIYFDCEDFQELVDYYLNILDNKQADLVLKYAFEQHPNNIELKIAKTHVLIANNKFKEALVLINEIEKIQPLDAEVQLTKGTVFSRLKMSDKALKCFNLALESAEFKEDVYFLIALEYQHNMDYQTAIKFHKKAIVENPEFEPVLYELTLCFECTNDFKSAIQFFLNYIDNNPYSETAWFNLGGMYSRIEDYDKSVDAYDYAIAINPYFASAYFNKANALAADLKYEEAIKTYKETYEHETPNCITYSYIGECFERLNDFDNALLYYDKALLDSEDYPDAWLGKAITLDHLGKSLEAYHCIKKALELDDEEPDYWYACSEIEEKLGCIEDAINSMKTAIDLDTTDITLTIDYLQLIRRNLDF